MLTENSVLLTSSVISPALKTAIAKLGLRHISVDPVSVSNRLDVYEGFAGKRGLPTVDLENASTVFAVGADFLGDWGGQNLMATYAERRKPSEGMLKHIQAEAGLTLSGSNADVRIKARVSEYESILAHVYNKVASVAGLITLNSPALREDISQNQTFR